MSQPEQQIQVEVPPMNTVLDGNAINVLLTGLGELPGKLSTPYINALKGQWDAHCQRHVELARAKAAGEADAAKKAAAEAAAAGGNRAKRRAKRS
jgi:hypothetical protein